MRLLVLGGTVFLSEAVAAEAVRRGHEVVCACRGRSGDVPPDAELVVWDRDHPAPDALTDRSFDVVVDVARHSSRVRRAAATWPDSHWVFVSTVSVYADESTPGGGPATTPLLEPRDEDVDLSLGPEAYGAMKVACEGAVTGAVSSSLVLRPGLIVGPGDPTGRFGYWPKRLAEGGEVLAPGDPDDRVQVIDVRDLASWIVSAGESRLTGVLDAVGPVRPLRRLLEEVADGVGVRADLTWVGQDLLAEEGVEPWTGPDSVPLWLPRPAYDGMLAHDERPAVEAGLVVRPIAETARDTAAWLREDPDATVTGIDRERERALLGVARARAPIS